MPHDDAEPIKRPRANEIRSAARWLRQEAVRQRGYAVRQRELAELHASKPDVAAMCIRTAAQMEARALRWEKVGKWLLGEP